MRNQLFDFDARSVNPSKSVTEIFKCVDSVELAAVEHGIQHCRSSRSVVRAGKEIVLSSECHRSHLILDQIVIELISLVSEKPKHRHSLSPGVCDDDDLVRGTVSNRAM